MARGDIALVRDAVLGLGEFHGTADKKQLYRDIEAMLDKYGSADLGTMDLAEVFEDMTSVMKTQRHRHAQQPDDACARSGDD